MMNRIGLLGAVLALAAAPLWISPEAPACCPAGRLQIPVVNADQSVIIIWDAANKVQHFIRRASFKSEGDDFGFLIPSPTQPDLNESGNEAFPYLESLTAPIVHGGGGGFSCGCAAQPMSRSDAGWVKVLEEKTVAGFNAAVLETHSADALVAWLKERGYAYSPEVAAWAKPYVEAGWKITALKVAKDKDTRDKQTVAAGALRMSFKTDRPLFPYREPDSTASAAALGAKQRLLRIYFLAEARYQGELTKDIPWTGKVAWAGKLTGEDRKQILELLKLPEKTGPAEWYLTEFEDNWPYRVAPADVYFSRSADQQSKKRDASLSQGRSLWPTDAMVYALAAALVLPPLVRRVRRRTS